MKMESRIFFAIVALGAGWLIYAELYGPTSTKYLSKLATKVGG
jgi:hypothetical protein